MKTKLFLMTMAAAAIVLTACSKDNDESENIGTSVISGQLVVEVSNIDNDDNSRINSVKLVIEGGSKGKGYEVDNVQYDQSKRRFTIDLSKAVPDQYLEPYDDEFDDGIRISNPNVGANSAWLYAYSGSGSSPTGAFFHGTGGGDGEWKGGLIYVNEDVTITGSGSDEDTWDGYTEKINYKYSINWKKGWNILYCKNSSKTTGKVTEYWDEFTSQAPAGAVWFFVRDI